MIHYGEYFDDDLERSFALVKEHYPHITRLVEQANNLLLTPHYHLNAWKQIAEDEAPVYVELLYGDHTTSNDLQILNYSLPQIEGALMGFINGFNIGQMSRATPKQCWDNFINHLKEVETPELKNFIGSTEKYKKQFLQANKNG